MNARVVSFPPDGTQRHGFTWMANPSRWVVALLLMLGLLLAVNAAHRLLAQSESGLVRFIINGKPVILDAPGQAALRRDLEARRLGFEARIEQRLVPWLDSRLAEIEDDFRAAGADYLDWHFSLTGSYARLGVALMGDLDAWMEAQLHRRLIEPSGLEASLTSLRETYSERLVDAEQAWLADTLSELQRRSSAKVGNMSDAEASRLPTVSLDRLVAGAWQDQLALPRWSATQGAGAILGGMTGRAIAQRLSTTAAMQAGRQVVRQVVARLGVQAARSVAMGGTAAAATAPSGPGALLAGGVTAATVLATAAGSEYLVLEAQEAMQRPAMEAQLDSSWEAWERRVRHLLDAGRAARAEALHEHLKQRAAQAVEASELPKTYRILG